MNIYAIADLHLSGMADKPMNVFGPNWDGHFEKIKEDWLKKVKPEDVVLISGDISWGMKPEEGIFDVLSLKDLPGKKVLCRGNHDYWWQGIGKLRDAVKDTDIFLLQNDCIKIGNFVIVGSRGWTCPGSNEFNEAEDKKLYLREAERFRLAFRQANRIKEEGDVLIAMIHYPPFTVHKEDTLFSKLFEENGVSDCVFGHIHGVVFYPLDSEKNGVKYHLTSSDKLGFKLKKIF